MTKQVQIRGAATATQAARTLAARELDVDTTLKRLNVHDGSTPGGVPHANYTDIQKNNFIYAVGSGTNAITATYAPAPAALQSGMEFLVKAANTNTAAVTFNPNGLGATNVKKLRGGVKIPLGAGDIVANIIYRLIYDGTDFLLLTSGGGGNKVVATTNISSDTANIDFAGIFTPGNNYRILFAGLAPVQNADELRVRLEQSSSFVTGASYDWNYDTIKPTGSQDGIVRATNSTYIELLGAQGDGQGFHGEMLFVDPAGGGVFCQTSWNGAYADNSDIIRQLSGGGGLKNTTAVTGIRIFFGAGDIMKGRVSVFEEALS